MSTKLWTPGSGLSEILFTGILEFRDVQMPSQSKDEWGADTIDRYVRGPAYLFDDYVAALRQGDAFRDCYLQTWRPSSHPIYPGLTLSYKGFPSRTFPDPLPSSSRSELMSSLTANNLSVSVSGGKTIVNATQEIKYDAPQTVWRYISNGEPNGPRFTLLEHVRGKAAQILDSRLTVTFSDGTTSPYPGSVPIAVVTALFRKPAVFTIGPSFVPIIGTPYYECEETVQLRYQ